MSGNAEGRTGGFIRFTRAVGYAGLRQPGYNVRRAFTSGSSIELSSDAPLREPYAVWMQGGINFHSGKLGVMLAADEIIKRGLLE